MNRPISLSVLLLSLVAMLPLAGCVTAHEGTVTMKIIEFPGSKPVDNALLLTVHCQSVESPGRWWVFQDEEGGTMMPQSATVRHISTGEKLHQKGHVIGLMGPYTKGKIHSWEYWVFCEGRQGDDFLDIHFERSYEDDKPLQVSLAKVSPGNKYSDEKVLDGARKFAEVQELLPNDDPDVERLRKLLTKQLQAIQRQARDPRHRKDAKNLLIQIRQTGKRQDNVSIPHESGRYR